MKVTFNLSDEFRRQFKRLAKKYIADDIRQGRDFQRNRSIYQVARFPD